MRRGSRVRLADVVRVLPRRAHQLSRSAVKESQRWRMLEAVTEAVGKRGYGEASVADVIGLAGVSRKTFYEHFRDKEDCFLTAFEALSERFARALVAAGAEHPAGAPRRRAMMARYVEGLARDPLSARVFTVDVLGAGERALDARERVNASFGIAIFGRAVPAARRTAIVGGVNALSIAALRDGDPAKLPQLLGPICAFIEAALLEAGS